VASGWGDPRPYRGEGEKHEGLDFRASVGTPIFAVGDGKVVTSKNALPDPAGDIIAIQHDNGILSRYLHLSVRQVKVGDIVRAGQQIAESGASGIKQSAAHLHFDLKIKPDRLSEYTGRFGIPVGGFPSKQFGFIPIPAEPLVPVDQWRPGVRERAVQNNIPIFTETGIGVVGYALILGGLYYVLKG